MRTAFIGGIQVSVVGLGCNSFGRDITSQAAAAVVDAALETGITFFDTADTYGAGHAEEILAAALGARLNDVVIATKFGNPVEGVEGSGGARPEYIARAIERSLRKLGRDWIDLYQIHRGDPLTPIEETLGALQRLVVEGKVRAIGSSNFTVEELAASARSGAGVPFVSTQIEYSIVNREPETSGLTAFCEAQEVAILPYRPLAKGLLSGRMKRGDTPVRHLARDRYQRFLTGENFDLVSSVEALAAANHRHPAEVALAWLLSRPTVPSVIPGATSPSQVRINAAVGDWELDADDIARLDAVFG